jgi:hypothetical protein
MNRRTKAADFDLNRRLLQQVAVARVMQASNAQTSAERAQEISQDTVNEAVVNNGGSIDPGTGDPIFPPSTGGLTPAQAMARCLGC